MNGVEELVSAFAGMVALSLEMVSIVVIGGGALVAVLRAGAMVFEAERRSRLYRTAWQGLARALLLGLELMLAADVVRTAIAPDWTAIGQLAAIAVIRTFLNHFLERDVEAATRQKEPESPCPT